MIYSPISSIKEPIQCNILLIGKTGTGKSSFANYLFDTERFTTGSGAPVTGWENNFQCHYFTISNVSVNVYDSVGLEPNNFNRWARELDDFLSKKQPHRWGNVNSANSIIHTIFYVINGTDRIVDTEASVFKKIRMNHNLSVSIIITNCDIAKEAEIVAIEKIANKHGLNSFRVCSISKKNRVGSKIEPFGKEPAIKQILSASYEKVGKELTLSLLQEVINMLFDLKRKIKRIIDDSDLSIFNLGAIDEIESIDLDDILPDIADISDLIPLQYKSYQDFLESFDVSYQGRDIINETIENLGDIFDDISENDIKIMQKGEQLIDDIEHGGLFTKVSALFKFGGMILFIKNTLKQGCDECFDLAISKTKQQMRKVEATTFDV